MNAKKLLAIGTLGAVAALAGNTASAQGAGDCSIAYVRTACPGKEAESYAKCDGKAACTKQVDAATPQACQAQAVKACANDRLDTTKSKEIKAAYQGQSLKSASGKEDFCLDYDKRAAEFDKCGK
jgi:hypothetical protein